MATTLGNRVRVLCATTGTGTLTLGAAFNNAFCTFAEAGIPNGSNVTYIIEEGLDFQIARGIYTSSGTTLTRVSTILSKIAGTAGAANMSLLGAATVRVIGVNEDLLTRATADEYRAGTAVGIIPDVDKVWDAAGSVTLTDAATIAVDFATGFNFDVALGGNRTLGAPSNLKNGQAGVVSCFASGGARTLTLNAAWLLATGIEVGPYAIPSSNRILVAYTVLANIVFVTGILRYPT